MTVTRGPYGFIPVPGNDDRPPEKPSEIAAGSFVMFSTGYDDTYCPHGLYRVLKPLPLKDMKITQQYPEDVVIPYFVDQGIIERVEYIEVNMVEKGSGQIAFSVHLNP